MIVFGYSVLPRAGNFVTEYWVNACSAQIMTSGTKLLVLFRAVKGKTYTHTHTHTHKHRGPKTTRSPEWDGILWTFIYI